MHGNMNVNKLYSLHFNIFATEEEGNNVWLCSASSERQIFGWL